MQMVSAILSVLGLFGLGVFLVWFGVFFEKMSADLPNFLLFQVLLKS